MNRSLRSLRYLTVAVLWLAMAVSAHAQTSPQVVRLGILPIVGLAPIYLGQERGFFKDEGLKLDIHVLQGGPEITAATIGGDVDFGYTNPVSPILAVAQGAPVKIVAPGDMANDSVVNGVLVKTGSPIKTLKDLEGRRVAVNALKGVLELVVREGVLRDKGNPDRVTFVEAPFPQMATLLTSGQVDAVVNVEPFVTAMTRGGGARIVANAFVPINGGPAGVWIASTKRLENRDLVERFRRAVARANSYASKNPQEVRRIIQTYTRIGADAAAKIALPSWSPSLVMSTVQDQIDMLRRHNFMRRDLNASDIVAK